LRDDGKLILIDIKTGQPHPAVDIQVAAYRELVWAAEGIECAGCKVLYLRDDGTYRLVESKNHRRNLNVFLAALTIIRWKKEHGV